MGHSHPSPSARNRQENSRQFSDEFRLLLECEFQVPVTLVLRGERGKDPSAYTEVRRPHVRAFLCPLEAQGNPAEISCIHREITPIEAECYITQERTFSGY